MMLFTNQIFCKLGKKSLLLADNTDIEICNYYFMKQLTLILFTFLLNFHLLIAQNQANNWYFGVNAGLTFNTTPPSALTDGVVNTAEGSATMSDASGNLLFYTDGITVWNRNHQIMPNGTGLLGDPSAAQSAIIVPKPVRMSDRGYFFRRGSKHQCVFICSQNTSQTAIQRHIHF